MEDRLAGERPHGRGLALIALAAIAGITVAWWALALWPAGSVEPEWLARTRAACFGSSRGGLPDAGGWILLIGEPLGMLAMLGLLYGESLRRDLEWIGRRRAPRLAAAALGTLTVLVIASLALRATAIGWAPRGSTTRITVAPVRVNRAAPNAAFVDQHGRAVSLHEFAGRPALLTFAFGHCTTVCPATVMSLQAARRAANLRGVPIVILTLDPWRDTPDRLPTIAQHWGLEGEDRVVSGTIDDVNRALDELGVGRRRSATTGDVDHSAAAMIVDARGRIAWRVDGGPRELAALLSKI